MGPTYLPKWVQVARIYYALPPRPYTASWKCVNGYVEFYNNF